MEPVFLGLDIGGTKTSVCVGRTDGSLRAARRIPSEATAGARRWFERAAALALDVLREAGLRPNDLAAAGISSPGPMSVERGVMIAPPNMPGWIDVPIVEWMKTAIGCPVFINNDANACVLAEYLFGEYRGTPDLVYLTMSTGVGAGVITGGRLLQDRPTSAAKSAIMCSTAGGRAVPAAKGAVSRCIAVG